MINSAIYGPKHTFVYDLIDSERFILEMSTSSSEVSY
jgi:hypothetical protein